MKDPDLTAIMAAIDRELPIEDALEFNAFLQRSFQEAARPRRRHKLPGCSYCKGEGANTFHPPHDASDRCESGKRNHCSCDRCF
jgi:hypothetical protein